MKLEVEIYDAYCSTGTFVINDVVANSEDFGWQGDRGYDAPDYCCSDMQFERKQPTDVVLKKYNIDKAEYALIAGLLEEGLSFGSCGMCS